MSPAAEVTPLIDLFSCEDRSDKNKVQKLKVLYKEQFQRAAMEVDFNTCHNDSHLKKINKLSD